MPTEGGQENLPGSDPAEQKLSERTPDQGLSVSQQETITQPQTENAGLLTRSVRGLIHILKDITSGRAQKLNTHGPRPIDNSEQTQNPQNEPSQS